MTTIEYTDWQWKQKDCECNIHRYHVAHICLCGKVISHGQGDWDTHKFHGGMLNVDPFWIKHGDSVGDVIDRYIGYGYFTQWLFNEETAKIYSEIVEKFGN